MTGTQHLLNPTIFFYKNHTIKKSGISKKAFRESMKFWTKVKNFEQNI